MYKINEDLSIYATRGDIVLLNVRADFNGDAYVFAAGDLVRIKVYQKKNPTNVVLEKDFPVTSATQEVQIFLSKEDTKIGEVISKPVDYWYEVELNPLSEPQTIIGYDEDGAKVFKLFPEGADKEVEEYIPDDEEILSRYMDDELDLASKHPVENHVIARAIARLEAGYRAVSDIVTPQMFGAVGDGETDDTESIQAAIDIGKSIRIPRGAYKVTSDIVIDANDVDIVGDGAVLLMNGHNVVVGGGSAEELRSNFSISGVELSYGSLKVKRLNNFSVDNCYVHNATHGIVGSHCYNGDITNSKFADCEYGVMFDKDILAPNETADHNVITVRNCKFYNNTDTAFVIRGGHVGEFSFNAVEGNNKGISVEGMADFKILSNYFEYNNSDIITLKDYGTMLNSSIQIGGNRLFGKADSSITGMVLRGTVIGLFLQPNSWGGLNVLIDNQAVLSGPVLLYQVNNTTKKFPNFIGNMRTINPELVINPVSTAPEIITGRMFTFDDVMHAHTKLGDYVLDYKLGYVPMLNTTPTSGDGLLYLLPDGTLRIKINGEEKQVTLS